MDGIKPGGCVPFNTLRSTNLNPLVFHTNLAGGFCIGFENLEYFPARDKAHQVTIHRADTNTDTISGRCDVKPLRVKFTGDVIIWNRLRIADLYGVAFNEDVAVGIAQKLPVALSHKVQPEVTTYPQAGQIVAFSLTIMRLFP